MFYLLNIVYFVNYKVYTWYGVPCLLSLLRIHLVYINIKLLHPQLLRPCLLTRLYLKFKARNCFDYLIPFCWYWRKFQLYRNKMQLCMLELQLCILRLRMWRRNIIVEGVVLFEAAENLVDVSNSWDFPGVYCLTKNCYLSRSVHSQLEIACLVTLLVYLFHE